ncbi:MAG: hypothetical protein ABIG63_17560 [Chloroflexota bacterium]
MSQEERYNTRDRSYSAWHRRGSTRRYVGIEAAQTLAMIDLDASLYVEYDDGTKDPLALVETAIDRGQPFKPATVTKKLAQRCFPTVPAYVLLYKLSNTPNPTDRQWMDIKAFRVRRLWPEPETNWEILTPQQWANRLVVLRQWSAKRIDRAYPGTEGTALSITT